MSNVIVALTKSGTRYSLNTDTCVLTIRRTDRRGGQKIGFDYTVPEGRFENVEAHLVEEGKPAHFRTKQGDYIRTSPVVRMYEAVLVTTQPRPLAEQPSRPLVQVAQHGVKVITV
jgi:hypothetical protein